MANVFALRSVVTSLATTLNNAAEAEGSSIKPLGFKFVAVSSGQLADNAGDAAVDQVADNSRVTLFVYRVAMDPHLRTAGRPQDPDMSPVPLSLDVHVLFSIWSNSAENELSVLAWLMRELHLHPVLDAATLSNDGGWGLDEVIHLIPEELSTEDLMRLWDALTPSYRLSVSYIARVVRIDPETLDRRYPPVVARRFAWQEGSR